MKQKLCTLALLLVFPACASATFAKLRGLADANMTRQPTETDPSMRAWREGFSTCAHTEMSMMGDPYGDYERCFAANDEKLITGLRARAQAESDPRLRAATESAAACVEAVPRAQFFPPSDIKGRAEPAVRACVERERGAVETKRKDEDAYAELEREDSVDGWLGFVEKHPDDARVGHAVERVSALADRMSGDAQLATDEKLVAVHPAALSRLPASRRVLLAGPKGARPGDLRKMADAKVAPSIVLARVRASAEPYRNFEADELVALKQMGIGDDVVAAMIEVTTKLEERRRADDERRALRAELDALKKLIEEKNSAPGGSSGQIVQTKEGPMDLLASCAKRLTAMKLCDQIPFPGSTICSSSAESSFPCPKN